MLELETLSQNYLVVKHHKSKVSIASWYDYDLKGAPGYSLTHLTAASRDYPRGTRLLVTEVTSGKWIIVRVNDYGPEAWTKRQIDLSSYAFKQLAPLKLGLLKVKIERYDK